VFFLTNTKVVAPHVWGAVLLGYDFRLVKSGSDSGLLERSRDAAAPS
jgi:hypothetical protein